MPATCEAEPVAEPVANCDMTGGYIKLYRRSFYNPVFRDPADWNIWVWLLMTAQTGDYDLPTKFGPITLHEGEILIAERVVAERFGITRHQLRALLDRLVAEEMLNRKPNRKCLRAGTVYEIANYHKYQRLEESLDDGANRKRQYTSTANSTKNNLHSNKKVRALEPDGSREVIGAAADRSPVPPAGPKSLSPEDRQFLGTDAALPGQLPLPGMPDLCPPVEAREPVTVPDPVEDDAPEQPAVEPDLFPPEPDPTIMQAPAPARHAPKEVGAAVTGTVVALPKPAEIAEQMRAIWNEECADLMPEIRGMPPKRLAAMTKALRTFFANDLGRWRAYCQRLRRSPFMTGDNNRGWVGNIDTCIRADIVTKALEGNYDDREQRHANRPEASGALRGAAATMDLARQWLG